jgi:hypothetical protein
MKGSIRLVVGFLVVFGAVGGIENAGNDMMLIPLMGVAILGLMSMYSGVKAQNNCCL